MPIFLFLVKRWRLTVFFPYDYPWQRQSNVFIIFIITLFQFGAILANAN